MIIGGNKKFAEPMQDILEKHFKRNLDKCELRFTQKNKIRYLASISWTGFRQGVKSLEKDGAALSKTKYLGRIMR